MLHAGPEFTMNLSRVGFLLFHKFKHIRTLHIIYKSDTNRRYVSHKTLTILETKYRFWSHQDHDFDYIRGIVRAYYFSTLCDTNGRLDMLEMSICGKKT